MSGGLPRLSANTIDYAALSFVEKRFNKNKTQKKIVNAHTGQARRQITIECACCRGSTWQRFKMNALTSQKKCRDIVKAAGAMAKLARVFLHAIDACRAVSRFVFPLDSYYFPLLSLSLSLSFFFVLFTKELCAAYWLRNYELHVSQLSHSLQANCLITNL